LNLLSLLVAAIAPGIALLAYFYLKDRYHSEPIRMVAKMFLLGVLIVFPTMILQQVLIPLAGDNSFLYAFTVSAGLEEFLKWFVVFHVIYKHSIFDEPYDGIIYAVAVSLGFATLENIIYALVGAGTFSSLLFRAFLPVSAHAMFGVMMGYYLGRAKFHTGSERKYIAFSLAFPVFYHGLFDYILLTVKTHWLWLMVPLMAYLWLRALWNVKRANARSPYRVVHQEDEIKTI